MRRAIFLSFIALGIYANALAQDRIDSVFVDVRGTYAMDITSGEYSSRMRCDYFNVHMYGHITDNVSYRIRQRMNVPIDSSNPFRATDWLCLKWAATPSWSFSVGKGAILIGGYEYDAAPIDVYFYSKFCVSLQQCFGFNVSASHSFAPGQAVTFQVCNSPLQASFQDIYAYNLAWDGHFAPWWKTIWTVNLVEDPYRRNISYIALGNHWVFGGLAVDLDLMNRASFHQQQYFFSDYTIISKFIWNIGRWNLCGKIGYEKNSASNVDADGLSYDTVITAGTEYLYGGVGIEYFPLPTDRIRLHTTYFRDSHDDRHNIEFGIKWRFDIWKR